VLASVFTATGGYATPALFVAGLRPAVVVGAAVLAAGALAALLVPSLQRQREAASLAEPAIADPVATAA
jgi:hypothetical protein